jgi:hypothetical protein
MPDQYLYHFCEFIDPAAWWREVGGLAAGSLGRQLHKNDKDKTKSFRKVIFFKFLIYFLNIKKSLENFIKCRFYVVFFYKFLRQYISGSQAAGKQKNLNVIFFFYVTFK